MVKLLATLYVLLMFLYFLTPRLILPRGPSEDEDERDKCSQSEVYQRFDCRL